MRPVKSCCALILFIQLMGCSTLEGPPRKGLRYHDPYPGKSILHMGIDLDVPYGTAVRAINDGEVTFISADPKDLYVMVNHGDGRSAMYVHLGEIIVGERQTIKRGQIIAYTGRSGYDYPGARETTGKQVSYPHLHLEIFRHGSGIRINPESLPLTCPSSDSRWWWPVSCEEFYKGQ